MNKGRKEKEGPNNKNEANKGIGNGETYYPFVQITETGDCEPDIAPDPSDSAKTSGRMLFINSDARSDYFTLKELQAFIPGEDHDILKSRATFNLFDNSFDINVFDSKNVEVYLNQEDRCYVGLQDKDAPLGAGPSASEDGQVEYSSGTLIRNDGKFPPFDSYYVVGSRFEDTNIGDTYNAENIYDNLVDKGFTGEPLDRKNSEILFGLEGSSEANFKLYGDLVCGDPDSDGVMKWYMCHDGVEHDKVEGYQCDYSENRWVED